MDADGTGQGALTSGGSSTQLQNDEEPAWSPDGSMIAFTSDRENENGDFLLEIYTMNTDGSGLTRITNPGPEPESNRSPAWSPDGQKLAYEHQFLISGNPEIWVMDADGTGERAVTQNGFTANIHPAWSPDGQRIAFSGQDGCCEGFDSEIFTINVDGSGQTQLTDNAVSDEMPDWQPVGDGVGGDVVVTDCTDPTLATLTSVAGRLVVQGLTDCASLSLPVLTDAGGVVITGNAGLDTVSLPSLGAVAGDVTISDAGTTVIDLGGGTVSGDVTIFDNGTATVSMGGGTVSGDVTILDNGTATVSIGSGEVAGDLTIVGNGRTTVSLGGGAVAGNVTLDGLGAGELDLPATSGDVTIDTSGYDTINGASAGGFTSISNADGQAVMQVVLPDGTFETPVTFTITRLDPATVRRRREPAPMARRRTSTRSPRTGSSSTSRRSVATRRSASTCCWPDSMPGPRRTCSQRWTPAPPPSSPRAAT